MGDSQEEKNMPNKFRTQEMTNVTRGGVTTTENGSPNDSVVGKARPRM